MIFSLYLFLNSLNIQNKNAKQSKSEEFIWRLHIAYIDLFMIGVKSEDWLKAFYNLVPGAGVEPARLLGRGILSPLCLPIPPPGLDTVYMEAEPGIEPRSTALQAAA